MECGFPEHLANSSAQRSKILHLPRRTRGAKDVFGFRELAAETTETSLPGYLPHVQQVRTFLIMCFEGQISSIVRKSQPFLVLLASRIMRYYLEQEADTI